MLGPIHEHKTKEQRDRPETTDENGGSIFLATLFFVF
jgi:hypothetical protein